MVKTIIFPTKGTEDLGENYKGLQGIVKRYGNPIFETDTVTEWYEHEDDKATLASLYQVDKDLVSIISMSTKDRVLQAGDIVKLSDNTNPELVN